VQLLPREETTLNLSAETMGSLYEFTRHGNTFDNFIANLRTIERYKIKYRFSLTISNLTVLGYKEFQDTYGTDNDFFNVLVDPTYLCTNVIDERSRDIVNSTDYKYHGNEIKQAINVDYSDEQKSRLQEYLPEYARRRNLSLDVFPDHFRNWVNGTSSN